MQIEVNNRKIIEKPLNTWKLNHTLLNNPWVKEEASKKIKKYIELNEMKIKLIKVCGTQIKQYWEGNLALNTYFRKEECLKLII